METNFSALLKAWDTTKPVVEVIYCDEPNLEFTACGTVDQASEHSIKMSKGLSTSYPFSLSLSFANHELTLINPDSPPDEMNSYSKQWLRGLKLRNRDTNARTANIFLLERYLK